MIHHRHRHIHDITWYNCNILQFSSNCQSWKTFKTQCWACSTPGIALSCSRNFSWKSASRPVTTQTPTDQLLWLKASTLPPGENNSSFFWGEANRVNCPKNKLEKMALNFLNFLWKQQEKGYQHYQQTGRPVFGRRALQTGRLGVWSRPARHQLSNVFVSSFRCSNCLCYTVPGSLISFSCFKFSSMNYIELLDGTSFIGAEPVQ